MRNFDDFYHKNYSDFWKVLHCPIQTSNKRYGYAARRVFPVFPFTGSREAAGNGSKISR